jgi:outer membrane protein assembly factor BamB
MVENPHNDSVLQQVKPAGPWYGCAVATAIVSAIFSLIVCTFLLMNLGRSRMVGTPNEAKLVDLRTKIRNDPNNEQLLSRMREFDAENRRQRIRALDLSHKGSYLLLAGLVVFMISLRIAVEFKKRLPAPQPKPDQLKEQNRIARFSRWTMVIGLLILGSGAAFLATKEKIDFAKAGSAGVSSFSMKDVAKNWASFRGPNGAGISAYTNVPSRWDGKTSQGILWKTEIPLTGNNSPVVWNDRIFLSGADPNYRQVFCFDTTTGKLLWKGDVLGLTKSNEKPLEMSQETGYAAPTVATDGRRVYAIFPTGDLACFDFKGKKIWEQNLGRPDNSYGYASSLAMYKNLLLIQYDQGGIEDEKSNLIALDGFSGRIAWQTKRPVGNSWSSPIVAKIGEQFQIITSADPWVIGYNPDDGTEIWRANCINGDIAPSPIYANGLVFAIAPYSKLVAVKVNGKGDVTKTNIAWVNEEGGPDICSPLSDGKYVFLMATEGLLQCLNVSDGKKVWEKDFQEYFLASPSLVGDKLYLLSEKGVMYIAEIGSEYKQLVKCELGEKCFASPAFADRRIYIRGVKNLYCIGNGN